MYEWIPASSSRISAVGRRPLTMPWNGTNASSMDGLRCGIGCGRFCDSRRGRWGCAASRGQRSLLVQVDAEAGELVSRRSAVLGGLVAAVDLARLQAEHAHGDRQRQARLLLRDRRDLAALVGSLNRAKRELHRAEHRHQPQQTAFGGLALQLDALDDLATAGLGHVRAAQGSEVSFVERLRVVPQRRELVELVDAQLDAALHTALCALRDTRRPFRAGEEARVHQAIRRLAPGHQDAVLERRVERPEQLVLLGGGVERRGLPNLVPERAIALHVGALALGPARAAALLDEELVDEHRLGRPGCLHLTTRPRAPADLRQERQRLAARRVLQVLRREDHGDGGAGGEIALLDDLLGDHALVARALDNDVDNRLRQRLGRQRLADNELYVKADLAALRKQQVVAAVEGQRRRGDERDRGARGRGRPRSFTRRSAEREALSSDRRRGRRRARGRLCARLLEQSGER